MKKIISCFLLLAFAGASAQDNKPYDMMVNGVKVVVVPSGNEIIQIDLVIKGGVQNYPLDKAGIEKMAMNALTECGTEKDDKNSFKNKLDEVDAQMYGYTQKDAAHFQLNCIKSDLETVWPLYVDALTLPKFDAKEFDRIRNEAINNLREMQSNPDADLQKMAMETAFKGMDYAKLPGGTIDNLKKFTPAETKSYYKSILTRSRIFIVVVGDLSKDDLQKKLTALLDKIPEGKTFELKRASYSPQANSFIAMPKAVATNYVMGISSAPAANSKDYLPAALASGMFYDKMFLEIRTKNGLSYAPAAYITSGLTPYSVMYVTTKEPDKYIAVARNTVDKLKKDGFPADDVRNMKTTYATYQYYQNETNQSLCSMVAYSEIESGDWHRAFTLKEDLQPITQAEVNSVFNKYIGNFTWVYQGDSKLVTPTLFTQKATPAIPAPKKAF
ncbi:MAG TPA: pitrilysin family protein [Chitinophagaceae bacterium]|nr:pitrilysin family protein [Chitinophagaceae bacterium]